MQFEEMNWFNRFVELTAFVRTTNPADTFLENCRIEICVLHAVESIQYPDLGFFGCPFDQRVVVETEDLDVWIGPARELTDERYVMVERRYFGLECFCDCSGHQVSVGSVDRAPVVE